MIPGSDAAIETLGLRKTYRSVRGRAVGVDGLDLRVPAGGVHALLGLPGSGKTTTLRLLTGLAHADAGAIKIFGVPVPDGLPDLAGRIGAVVGPSGFQAQLSGRRNLSLLASAAGVPRARVDEVLARVVLADRAKVAYGTYSTDEQRRLALAAALLREPDLLVVDEPSVGLDAVGTREIRQALRRLADQGTTVLVATGVLTEAQQIADTVTVLDEGRVLAQGSAADLLGDAMVTVRVRLDEPAKGVTALRAAGFKVRADGDALHVDDVAEPSDISRALAKQKLFAGELAPQREDLAAVVGRLRPVVPPVPTVPSRAEERAARKAAEQQATDRKKAAEQRKATKEAVARQAAADAEAAEQAAAKQAAIDAKAAAKDAALAERAAAKEAAAAERAAAIDAKAAAKEARRAAGRSAGGAVAEAGERAAGAGAGVGAGVASAAGSGAAASKGARAAGSGSSKSGSGSNLGPNPGSKPGSPGAKQNGQQKPGPKPELADAVAGASSESDAAPRQSKRAQRQAAFEAKVAEKQEAAEARLAERQAAAAAKDAAKRAAVEEKAAAKQAMIDDRATRKQAAADDKAAKQQAAADASAARRAARAAGVRSLIGRRTAETPETPDEQGERDGAGAKPSESGPPRSAPSKPQAEESKAGESGAAESKPAKPEPGKPDPRRPNTPKPGGPRQGGPKPGPQKDRGPAQQGTAQGQGTTSTKGNR